MAPKAALASELRKPNPAFIRQPNPPRPRIGFQPAPREPLPTAKSLRPMNAVLPEGKPVTEVTSGLIERFGAWPRRCGRTDQDRILGCVGKRSILSHPEQSPIFIHQT